MSFFKQAQEFAASANVNTDSGNNSQPVGASEGGFGSLLSSAAGFLQAPQGSPADDGSAAPASLPGGRPAPSDAELVQSSQLLFGAARGEKVDSTQLAGAASNILGGLAAHGNLDQGAYGTYVNQAEEYLDKYSGKGTGAAPAGAAPAGDTPPAQVESDDAPADPQAPPVNDESDVPARRPAPSADQSVESPADETADPAPVSAPSTDDYPSEQRAARPSPTASDDQY